LKRERDDVEKYNPKHNSRNSMECKHINHEFVFELKIFEISFPDVLLVTEGIGK